MINPRDTLELLADLYKQTSNPDFREAMAFRIYATYLANNEASTGRTATRDLKLKLKDMADYVAFGAPAGLYLEPRAFYCDDEMSAVIQQAASSMDSSDLTDPGLMPTRNGFCYFAGGIKISENMKIHAIIWTTHDDGTTYLYGFNDRIVGADGSVGSWDSYLELKNMAYLTHQSRWIYRMNSTYEAGEQLSNVDPEHLEKMLEVAQRTGVGTIDLNPRQVFHALLLMLNQEPEVIEITRTEATKKKAERLKAKNLPSDITVINMRHRYKRAEGTTASGESHEYSHRWVVNGFWRWQPYKDANKEWKRKRIWINPYIKGPADKPLHVTEKVYALIK